MALVLCSHLEVVIVTDCYELIELPFSNPTCYEAHGEDKMAWFPRLQELMIENCPKLTSVPPIPWGNGVARSAKIVRVGSGIKELGYPTKYGSKLSLEIEGEDGQGDALWNCLRFSNLTNIDELCVTNIPPLPLAHFHVLTSLKTIDINRCDSSGKELTRLLSFLSNLSTLFIWKCDNITGLDVAEHVKTASGEQQQQQQTGGEEEIITAAAAAQGLLLLPPHLQELIISNCKRIKLFCNPPHDDQAETAAGEGLQRLRSLSSLRVYNCPEFLSSYSSSSFLPFPTCLQHLTLIGVKHMETLRDLSNLTSLTRLSLEYLEGAKDEGLWPLLAHGRLTNLTLDHLPDFFAASNPSRPHDREVFSRSSKLEDLTTRHNTGFLAAPICSLFSSTLTRLNLSFDDEVEHLTKEQEEALQLLTSLQELRFSCPPGNKLQRLPVGLHKLINLEKLDIYECSAIRSLPTLPSSLRELEILWCPAFQSLPNSLPSSLEILKIARCMAIQSLPKDGLPISMRELDVHDHTGEELKRECRKLIGTIPIIKA